MLVYLDDILVYSPTAEDHEIHLRKVLEQLRECKLYGKRSKCDFGASTVEYLGHVVGIGQLQADPSKLSAVRDWPTPTCVKHVQQFLGLANYYNRYIPKFAQLALPLTQLLCKGIVWRWTEVEQASFDNLRAALVSPQVLTLPDSTSGFEVTTDASDTCVGAVLEYHGHPVAYFSGKLSPAECNYPVHNRNLLTIHLMMQRCCC